MGRSREYIDVRLDLVTLQPIRAPYQPKPTVMAYVRKRGVKTHLTSSTCSYC